MDFRWISGGVQEGSGGSGGFRLGALRWGSCRAQVWLIMWGSFRVQVGFSWDSGGDLGGLSGGESGGESELEFLNSLWGLGTD